MNKLPIGIIVGLAVGTAACGLRLAAADAEAAADKPGKPAEAENPLHLDAVKRATAGITVAAPRQVRLTPEIEAYGRVLDPTPYVALVAEEATARAALSASEKELDRVKKLFAAGGNASAQAVETAEAAAVRDRAALMSAHVRLLAGWGRVLAEHADIQVLQQTLAEGAALIRIDLLPGSTAAENPTTARVALLGSKDEALSVDILGPAPVADPQVQGPSFLALLRGHSLPAGASLRVTLAAPGQPADVLVVPRAAVVYHEGSAWVYVLGEKDLFQRRLVTLGRAVDEAIVVEQGVAAGDQVATAGAQQLLSAELQAGGSAGGED